MKTTFLSALGLSLLALTACERGGSPYCVDTSTELTDFDEASPEGMTANELLAIAEGEHELSLSWGGDPAEYGASVDMNAEGESALVLSVASRGTARWVDSEVEEPEGPVNDIAIECPDRLEVDVDLRLETADGMLLHEFKTVLAKPFGEWEDDTSGYYAPNIQEDIVLTELGGDLELGDFDPASPDDVDAWVRVAFPWGEGDEASELGGAIEGTATYEMGDTVMGASFAVATFGADAE